MNLFRIFLVLVLIGTCSLTAHAGWFEDTWPGVYERIKKLTANQGGYLPVDCIPSFEFAAPAMSIDGEFSLTLTGAGEDFLKDCLPPDHPVMTVFHRPGEILAYGLLNNNAEGRVLKEWIYTDSPNAPDGSSYQWRMSAGQSSWSSKLKAQSSKLKAHSSKLEAESLNLEDQMEERVSGFRRLSDGGLAFEHNGRSVFMIPKPFYETAKGVRRDGMWDISVPGTLSLDIQASAQDYPILIDPTVKYGQWLGGAGSTTVTALAVNGATIYVGGYTDVSTSWETVTFRGTLGAGGTEGFVVEIIDGGTPKLNWGQWLGGSDIDAVNALAVNGTKIYVGGSANDDAAWETVTFQGVFGAAATSEGFVVEIIDGGTPTLNWGQWLGAAGDDAVNALAVNGSTVYVGGVSRNSTGWETVTFRGQLLGGGGGSSDGFVVEIITGGTPTLNWGQWFGGGHLDRVNALAVNGTKIYVGGDSLVSTSWETVTFQGVFGAAASSEGFVVEIIDGGTPKLNWGQWLGGDSDNIITAVAVNGSSIYVAGYSVVSTAWETVTFQGTYAAAGAEGFVVEIITGGTPDLNWGQWLGGSGDDAVNALAVSGSSIYAGGYSVVSTAWETVTFQGTYAAVGTEGFVVEITTGGTPTLSWGQWLGGGGVDAVNALAVNGGTIYAGGYSVVSTSWETVTFQGSFISASQGFLFKTQDDATAAATTDVVFFDMTF